MYFIRLALRSRYPLQLHALTALADDCSHVGQGFESRCGQTLRSVGYCCPAAGVLPHGHVSRLLLLGAKSFLKASQIMSRLLLKPKGLRHSLPRSKGPSGAGAWGNTCNQSASCAVNCAPATVWTRDGNLEAEGRLPVGPWQAKHLKSRRRDEGMDAEWKETGQ
jgi:hypothetical protein